MGRYLDIARKLEEQKVDSPGSRVENLEPANIEPVKSSGRQDFVDYLTETEKEYYSNLIEIMQSSKFGMDLEAAEREAGMIIARNRQPFQIKQALQGYKRFGYIKVFSTILGEVIYLAKHEGIAGSVPDRNIPVFLESDTEAVEGLASGDAKLLLEGRIIFGGSFAK